jgi:hypothetical protein
MKLKFFDLHCDTIQGKNLSGIAMRLGVAVEVSHASDKAFYDIAAITKIPFLASHSNAKKICYQNSYRFFNRILKKNDRTKITGPIVSMRIPAARWIAFRPIVDGIRLTLVPLG